MAIKQLDFVDWLHGELSQRGWSQSEFARRSGIANSHVSRLLNREQRPGLDTMQAVATAFDLSLFEVLVRAGILPAQSERDSLVQQLIDMMRGLPEADREEILEIARIKLERTKRVGHARNE